MSIFPVFSSQKTRRALLGWLAVAALAFHGLIPLGYMPDVSPKAEYPLHMTICSGMDMASMDTDDGADQDSAPAKDKADNKLPDHPPCPFSVNAVFASVNAAPALIAPTYVFIAAVAFAAFALSGQRRYISASPRAPPFPA